MGGLVGLFRRRRAAAPVAAPGRLAAGAPPEVDVPEVDETELIALIEAAGADLSVAVVVRHVLLVNDPAAAEALAVDVRAAGYDAGIDTHDGGWTWIVGAARTVTLTPAVVAGDRDVLIPLAERHGAAYEGWEVRPS